MKLVHENEHLLVHFNDIMAEAIEDRAYPRFDQLSSLSDFSDGFMLSNRRFNRPGVLRSFLKGFELDV